jgi:hypothetical protein
MERPFVVRQMVRPLLLPPTIRLPAAEGLAPPKTIRVPSGLNATLYTSGYVECAYGGFGEGCRKRYGFVPYVDLPDGWFTKDGNSYCSEHWPMVRR